MTLDQLTRRCEVTSDWHYQQARLLFEIATKEHSAAFLIYTALEARLTFERYILEMSALATGEELSENQLEDALKNDGVFRLLEEIYQDYRKYLEFCNVIIQVNVLPIEPILIPDIRSVRRYISKLSKLCHLQLKPTNTVDDPEWLRAQMDLLTKCLDFQHELINGQRGAFNRESFPPEVSELMQKYFSNEIDLESIKIRLEIMKPALESRKT